MSDGNKLYLNPMPGDLYKAQEACYVLYSKLAISGAPRAWSPAVKYLGNDPIMSLLLSGPDCLLKSSLLSAIQAYVSLGDKLLARQLKRLNVSMPIQLLKNVKGIKPEQLARYWAEGHTNVIVVTKEFDT